MWIAVSHWPMYSNLLQWSIEWHTNVYATLTKKMSSFNLLLPPPLGPSPIILKTSFETLHELRQLMINRKVNVTELLILRVKTENMNKLLTFSQAFLVSFKLRIEDLFTGYLNSRSRRLAEQQLVSSWFMSKNSSMQRWCISYET